MTDEPINSRVERVLTTLTSTNQQVSFTAVAAATGISRTTLYRDPRLRALVEEHRNHAREARTLTGVATELVV
ncbi:helix-turn-helix domain-containing protein [Parafrankia sp. FMc2]|uniref:helix-turn-helix domain-containing protein n=1 Tax=Parafrankia sp. FMc2 TaxID=3233196 RepID=UPI0034D41A51